MVQTDRGPPVSSYKEEPVDDSVSIYSIDSFLSSLSTAVVLERFPLFLCPSFFLVPFQYQTSLSYFAGVFCYPVFLVLPDVRDLACSKVELCTRRWSACCTLQAPTTRRHIHQFALAKRQSTQQMAKKIPRKPYSFGWAESLTQWHYHDQCG